MTDARILQFPTRPTRPAGLLRAATSGAHDLAPVPWRIEHWPADDGYPERLWIALDAELDARTVRALAADLLEHADRID